MHMKTMTKISHGWFLDSLNLPLQNRKYTSVSEAYVYIGKLLTTAIVLFLIYGFHHNFTTCIALFLIYGFHERCLVQIQMWMSFYI